MTKDRTKYPWSDGHFSQKLQLTLQQVFTFFWSWQWQHAARICRCHVDDCSRCALRPGPGPFCLGSRLARQVLPRSDLKPGKKQNRILRLRHVARAVCSECDLQSLCDTQIREDEILLSSWVWRFRKWRQRLPWRRRPGNGRHESRLRRSMMNTLLWRIG